MNQGENTTWGIRLLVFFLNKFYLFMYICMYVCMYVCIGCVGSSLLCVGFLQLWRAGATLCCGAQASHCSGFFCCGAVLQARRLQQLWLVGSRAQAQQLLRGMWDLPRPGLEPVSPALAGGFLTTAPSGKPRLLVFKGKNL